MYLKRLEIHGFKSFANKTTLEFAQGIIAIVGPNGSGKSNVADCLRWVLGEQSAKVIRGKKSDDVIFAGSDKKTRLGFAEVVATFDNRDHRIPLDASEISIGRRIDRSGESEYLINGNRVRLLDVVDLVLKSNIGTSRYTVIGQGTIDQMVLAGPAEVKNLLDEASGVKTYYIKRERTLRRLEQTAQNLMRAEDLMTEIEPRLKSLRRQAKRMEARAELENELKIYQREYFGKTYWALKLQIDVLSSQLSALDTQRASAEQEVFVLREQVQTLENFGQGDGTAFLSIQNQLRDLQNQKNKFLEDASVIRGKMQSFKTSAVGDVPTIQVHMHQLSQRITDVKIKISESQNRGNDESAALANYTAVLKNLDAKLNELYAALQNPVTVDWHLVDGELETMQSILNNFYESLESGQTLETVKSIAQNFRDRFLKFRIAIKQTAGGALGTGSAPQHQLKELLAEKEKASALVKQTEFSLSKSRMSVEFLLKEQNQLEQEYLHVELELKQAQSGSQENFVTELVTQENAIIAEVSVLAEKISALEKSFVDAQAEQTLKQSELRRQEGTVRDRQDAVSKIKDAIGVLNIEKAKLDTQMEVLVEEIRRMLGQESLESIGSQNINSETPELETKILRLKNQLDMIGGMDELTLKEYQETETRFTALQTQVEDLRRGIQDLRAIMDELDEHIKKTFNEAFHKINEKFEYYFRILFNGGRAYLSMIKGSDSNEENKVAEEEAEDVQPQDQLRPEEKIVQKYERGASQVVGIDIKATPPNKKLASIQALSGGERALTSIALLCSMLTCFPSPFVVLDEVDAALDDANTIRFGQILGTLAHQTQFITITHNRETMSQSNILYGVTMGDDGISKLLSVKLDQARQYAK